MKQAVQAKTTGRRIFYISLAGAGILAATLWLLSTFLAVLAYLALAVLLLWIAAAMFIFQFFRDPSPAPQLAEGILSPAWGRVDYIDQAEEPDFMQGPCQRVSIFLSFFDVHVQNAPVSGTIKRLKHQAGSFFSTTNRQSSIQNENLLIGVESDEPPGERVAVRLIAGPIARRTIPYVSEGEKVERGARMSLIRFGSRVDLFLGMNTRVQVKAGEKVRGGHTIIATRC